MFNQILIFTKICSTSFEPLPAFRHDETVSWHVGRPASAGLLLGPFCDTEEGGNVFLRNIVISPKYRYPYIGLFLGSLFDLEYIVNMFPRNVRPPPNYMSNIQGAFLRHSFENASKISTHDGTALMQQLETDKDELLQC